MTLPNQYELDTVVLPKLRKAVRLVSAANPDEFAQQQAIAEALFDLLALVHDLADEVIRLKMEVER